MSERELTDAKRAAWVAYYTTLRDHPAATPEEKERAVRMLAVGRRLNLTEADPDDFV